MRRTEIIQSIIDKYNFQSYLEIGIAEPEANFMQIKCKYKESVDPYEPNMGNACAYPPDLKNYIEQNILTYKMTSDEFFAQCPIDKKYDVIFIDGLHLENQVGRDIINSFHHLNPGGVVIVHDCLPFNEEAQFERRQSEIWNGSTWKVIPKLREQNITFFVVDTDWGCGVLQYSGDPNALYYPEPADYDYNQVFSSQTIRNCVMHVVSVEEFRDIINQENN